MITSSIDHIAGDLTGHTYNIFVYYEGRGTYVQPTITYYEGSGWITVTRLGEASQDVVEYTITLYNFTGDNIRTIRTAKVTFSDSAGSLDIPVRQDSFYDSIWKDQSFNGGTVGVDFPYLIKIDGKDVYSGISMVRDSTFQHKIDFPRIVEKYISNSSDFNISDDIETLDISKIVDLYKITGTGEEYITSFPLCGDWSYERGEYSRWEWLSEPINYHYAKNMAIPVSLHCAGNIVLKVNGVLKSGQTTGTRSWYPGDRPDTPFVYYDLNSYISGYTSEFKSVTFYINTIAMTYPLTWTCGYGAFYYKNRFGGWDSFLIEGNVYKYDNYTRNGYSKENYNNINTNWAEVTDNIVIDKTYTTTTCWLSDEESDRLVKNLISSPVVYFQKFDGNPESGTTVSDLIPVNITNSTQEYKKFRNGRKLVRHSIEFKESRKTKTLR